MVAFVCKSPPDVLVFSVLDGKLVAKKALASEVVSILLTLKSKEIPWNVVEADDISRIEKSFSLIHQHEEDELHSTQEFDRDLEKLKNEMTQMFNETNR